MTPHRKHIDDFNSRAVAAVTDLQFANHGSIITCLPLTDCGRWWLSENINDAPISFGGVIAIEPRYLADIVEGARADGMICEG